MNPERMMTRPATIISRTPDGVDEYGDEIVVDGTPVSVNVELQQTQRSEVIGGVNVTIETLTLFLPPSVVFTPADVVTIDGVSYEADGPPDLKRHPRTGEFIHWEATVKRVA